jgi:hypothetical protein
MCLRRKVDCGIRKFRRDPWAKCRHFWYDKSNEENGMLSDDEPVEEEKEDEEPACDGGCGGIG